MRNLLIGLALLTFAGSVSAAQCQPRDLNGKWKLYADDFMTTVHINQQKLILYKPVKDGYGNTYAWIVGGYYNVRKGCRVDLNLELDDGTKLYTTHAMLDFGKTVVAGVTPWGAFTMVKKSN